MKKEDGLINFADDPYLNFRKIQAFTPWPSAHYFSHGKRVKITKARFLNGALVIEKIIPEGKGEMDFNSYYLPA
jgi:methionyl-tRNA formyltransferase